MKRFVCLITLSLLLSVAGCGNSGKGAGGSGLLEADESVVSAETSGRVIELRFDEGTEVALGDTLIVIDPSRLELELASAEAGKKVALANLDATRVQLLKARELESFATTERDRFTRLLKSGTTTQRQLDQAEHEYSQAVLSRKTAESSIATIEAELKRIEADINRIKRQLDDCYPPAPLAGIVTEKYVERGELVTPGKAIAKISRMGSLWVKVYLPSGQFAGVKVGDKATVDTESGGNLYEGEVIWTSQEAEFTPKNVQTEKSRANLVYAVKVRVENTDGSLKIGMPVYVTIGQ